MTSENKKRFMSGLMLRVLFRIEYIHSPQCGGFHHLRFNLKISQERRLSKFAYFICFAPLDKFLLFHFISTYGFCKQQICNCFICNFVKINWVHFPAFVRLLQFICFNFLARYQFPEINRLGTLLTWKNCFHSFQNIWKLNTNFLKKRGME